LIEQSRVVFAARTGSEGMRSKEGLDIFQRDLSPRTLNTFSSSFDNNTKKSVYFCSLSHNHAFTAFAASPPSLKLSFPVEII
jgi:hypothetical protein